MDKDLLRSMDIVLFVLSAAEDLADAVEDLLFAEGDHRAAVREAWQQYVDARARFDDHAKSG